MNSDNSENSNSNSNLNLNDLNDSKLKNNINNNNNNSVRVNRKRKFKRNNTEIRKKYKTFNIEDILYDNDISISESPFSESSIIEYKRKLRKRKYNRVNKSNIGNYESKKYKSFDIDEIMENNSFMAVDMKKESDEPTSYQDIFFRKDKDEWVTAINNELNNMKKMNVYTPIKNLPKGVNVISTRWVFKNIHDVNGRVYKKKQD